MNEDASISKRIFQNACFWFGWNVTDGPIESVS